MASRNIRLEESYTLSMQLSKTQGEQQRYGETLLMATPEPVVGVVYAS